MLRVVMFLSDEHALWLAFLAGLICFGVSLATLYLVHHARAAAQHRRAVALLQANNQRLRGMLDNLPQGVVLYDAQARIVTCNERYLEMYGLSRDVIKPGATLHEVVQHRIARGVLFLSDPERYVADIVRSMSTRKPFLTTNELQDGRVMSVVNRPTPDGGCVVTHLDVTERHKAEKELEETRSFLNLVIENVPAPVIVKDARDFKYVLINRAAEEYFGASRDRMIGRTAADLFSAQTADAVMAQEKQLFVERAPRHFEEQPVETVGRGMRIVSATRLPVMGADGQPRYLVAVLQDVTERKRAEARIARLAHYDTLTDLPNRAAFNECFAATLERAAAENEQFAVLCLDLDRFKDVNDVFGHAAGDALLRWVTAPAERGRRRRLPGAHRRRRVRAHRVRARRGREPPAASPQRMLAAVADDFEFERQPAAHRGERRRRDLSGRRHGGRRRWSPMRTPRSTAPRRTAPARCASSRPTWTRACASAASWCRICARRSGATSSCCTISRRPRSTAGSPASRRWCAGVIPGAGCWRRACSSRCAEESGLILEIGEWILREACREAASWKSPLNIAVNLSPVQFRHGDLVGLVHSVLLETGLSPRRLELEITESVLIDDFSRALSILRRLKALGVHIAMDDFGTGYSSLSNLQAFPFDKIKIDQSFIANVEKNEQSATIVRAVLGLGRGLSLPVSAEGIETAAQLTFLCSEDCTEVQGYLVGKPQPIEAYAEQTGVPAPPKADDTAAVA